MIKLELSNETREISQLIEERQVCVAVATLPRSGSSLMMRILGALSMNVVQTTDTPEGKAKIDKKQRERFGRDYHMNPDGFGEIVERPLFHYIQWLAVPYSAMKVVHPLKPRMLEFLTMRPCLVIQMIRDPESIRNSQTKSYGKAPESKDILTYQQGFAAQMREESIPVLRISYDALVRGPLEIIGVVADFINAPLGRVPVAASLVDPKKKRF